MTLDTQINLRRATKTLSLDAPSKTQHGQVKTPTQSDQPPQSPIYTMMFDRDGYVLTQNRHLFAASKWLSSLVDAEVSWPVAANQLRDYLAEFGYAPDHINQQIKMIEGLVAPWLVRLRRTDDLSEFS